MKASSKARILWVLILVLLISVCWVEALRNDRYKMGMSLAEVRLKCGSKYPLKKFAVVFPHPPSEQERKETEVYYLYDEESGILLIFNDYQVLVRKSRIKLFGVNLYRAIDRLRGD